MNTATMMMATAAKVPAKPPVPPRESPTQTAYADKNSMTASPTTPLASAVSTESAKLI